MINIEGGSVKVVTATGTVAITSGFGVIIGYMCAASATQGSIQFFAGTTTSASVTPVIPVVTTGNFVRFPVFASGQGLTIKYTGTLDPNLMLFWNPAGGTP